MALAAMPANANPALEDRANETVERYYELRESSLDEHEKSLRSADAEDRSRSADFLVAVLRKLQSDTEKIAADREKVSDDRRSAGAVDNRATDEAARRAESVLQFRQEIADLLPSRPLQREVVPVALALAAHSEPPSLLEPYEEKKWQQTTLEALRAVVGSDDPRVEPVVGSILDPLSLNSDLLLGALDLVQLQKLTPLSAPASRLTQHYRRDVRVRAAAAIAELGLPPAASYSPVESVKLLDAELRDFVAMSAAIAGPIPSDAPWVRLVFSKPVTTEMPILDGWGDMKTALGQPTAYFTVGESDPRGRREVSGWLVGETDTVWRIVDYLGVDHDVSKDKARREPRTLADEIGVGLRSTALPATLLPGAWAYVRGDFETAAALVLPVYRDPEEPMTLGGRCAKHFGGVAFTRMKVLAARTGGDAATVGSREAEAMRLGEALAAPLFDRSGYQESAALLMAQLVARSTNVPTERRISRGEWEKRKPGLSRIEQVAFLMSQLGLPDAVSFEVLPGNGQADDALLPLFAMTELQEMRIGLGELSPVVPYLVDETVISSAEDELRKLRRHGEFLPPTRVSTVAAELIDSAARMSLTRIDELRAIDDTSKQRRLEEIRKWCDENAGRSEADIFMQVLETSPDQRATFGALNQLTRLKDPRVIPYLIRRGDEATSYRGHQATSLYTLDTPDAVPAARRWLEPIATQCGSSDFNVKATCMYASLILLRHGNRAELEGYEMIRAVLDADEEGYWYNAAWNELASLGKPEAVELLTTALHKQRARTEMVKRYPLLACRLFKAGIPGTLELLTEKLSSTTPMGSTLSPSGGQVTLLEADHAAVALSRWMRGRLNYDLREPEHDRAQKREQLAAYLTEQFALASAGQPTGFPDTACDVCVEDNGPPALSPVGSAPVIAPLDRLCPPHILPRKS
jgi:hypothetical protein